MLQYDLNIIIGFHSYGVDKCMTYFKSGNYFVKKALRYIARLSLQKLIAESSSHVIREYSNIIIMHIYIAHFLEVTQSVLKFLETGNLIYCSLNVWIDLLIIHVVVMKHCLHLIIWLKILKIVFFTTRNILDGYEKITVWVLYLLPSF